jgi:hypothetical protein
MHYTDCSLTSTLHGPIFSETLHFQNVWNVSLSPKVTDHAKMMGVTMTHLKSYVTRSNEAILAEAGQTTAVSLVEAHHGPGGASGHSFGTPPRDTSSWSRWATAVSGSGLV